MPDILEALGAMSKEERKFVLCRSYPLFGAYYFGLKMDDFMGEMVEFTDQHRRSNVEIPAGHTKSSTFGKYNIIRHICWNPNIRIVLIMSVYEDAEDYCKAIEDELEGNERLKEDFGEFFNPADWKTSSFTVKQRQHRNEHSTLEIFGAGSKVPNYTMKGHGCEIVVCDDAVTEETSATPELRKKQLSWFRMAVQTCPRPMWDIQNGILQVPEGVDWPMDAPYNPTPEDPRYGMVIVPGTRFHPEDMYDSLEQDKTYDTLWLDCWTDAEETRPLWPGFWTNEALHAERESMGHLDFNKRYRNRPVDPSEMVFFPEWFDACFNPERSFGEMPRDEHGKVLDLTTILGFDPASGEESKFAAWPTYDLLGFPRGGDPGTDKRYVIDVFRKQVGVEWLLDIMLDGNPAIPHPGFWARYHFDLCKVEKNGFANLMLTHDRIVRARRKGIMIEPHLTGRNKQDPVLGVKSMEAIFRDGLVDIPFKTEGDKVIARQIKAQFCNFSFTRAGRKKSLTDFVMAFWFAELAIRAGSQRQQAYRHRTSPYTIHNPYYDRHRSGSTARVVGR